MIFQDLLEFLQNTFEQTALFDDYDANNLKQAGLLINKMKGIYPETEKSAAKMRKALYSCAIDLLLGGMNPKNYFEDGKLKAFKTVVTSKKGEPLMFKTIYEDEQEFASAQFVL